MANVSWSAAIKRGQGGYIQQRHPNGSVTVGRIQRGDVRDNTLEVRFAWSASKINGSWKKDASLPRTLTVPFQKGSSLSPDNDGVFDFHFTKAGDAKATVCWIIPPGVDTFDGFPLPR